MAASELEVAVFIDTDLGTRLAMAVPPDITAGALKGEVERVHFNCFPKIGEIKVHGFMVKQKSNFYHLPDTVHMNFASSGVGVLRSLHVKARPLNEFNKPCLPEKTDCIPTLSNSTGSLQRRDHSRSTCKNKIRVNGKKRMRKRLRRKECLLRPICRSIFAWSMRRNRKKANRNQLLKCMERKLGIEDLIRDAENSDGSSDRRRYNCVPDYEVETRKQTYVSSMVEAPPPSELSSEVLSVSSLIKRYFPNFDEVSSVSVTNPSSCGVTSRDTEGQPGEYLKKNMVYNKASPQFASKRAPNLLPFPLPSNAGPQKPERSKLGKRLVMASYHLGVSPSRERPEISLCNSKGRKLQEFMSSTLAKSSCFEISDSED